MPTSFDHQRHSLQVSGLFMFVLEALLLRYGCLGSLDATLVWTYVGIQSGLLFTMTVGHTLLQWFHVGYTAMFVLVPLLAQNPGVLALHLMMVLFTLALRAECGVCPVNTMERDAEKIYNESVVDRINFNLVFWCSGTATIGRWLLR
jgi:hypothetical protein